MNVLLLFLFTVVTGSPSISSSKKDAFLVPEKPFREVDLPMVPSQDLVPPETVAQYYGYVFEPSQLEEGAQEVQGTIEGIVLPEYLKDGVRYEQDERYKRSLEASGPQIALRNLRKTRAVEDGRVRVKRTFCSVCGGRGGYYRPVYRPVYRPSCGGGCGGGFGGGYGRYGGYGGYGGYGCCG